MSVLATAVQLAADVAPDEDKVRPGPIAFGLFVAFAAATFLLWRSMNKHLKRVPKNFDDDQDAPATDAEPGEGDDGSAR